MGTSDTEIKITEEMERAGLGEFWRYDEETTNITPLEAVRRIYREMEKCRIHLTGSSES